MTNNKNDTSNPPESLNVNQFDDDGLPGIDPEFPPEHSWASEDPALVNGGSETQDNLVTRMSRETDAESAPNRDVVAPMISHSGDPQSSAFDDEKQMVADFGRGDPDAQVAPEEAAMHIVEDAG